MANAGKTEVAIEWLQQSIRQNPSPEWYRGNLAWAYYLARRYEDAFGELQKLNKPRQLLLAAVYIKIGRVEEARALMANILKNNPNQSIAEVARWPSMGSLKRGWLEDLRQAGLVGTLHPVELVDSLAQPIYYRSMVRLT